MERDLVTSEGVDEGSAAMSSEGDAGPDPDASPDPGSGLGPRDGPRGPRSPEQEATPEPVVPVDQAAPGPGQQLEAGEG